MGHLVGFPVTLGGFKVDGEGEEGLFRHSHQVSAFIFGFPVASISFPVVLARAYGIEPLVRIMVHDTCQKYVSQVV